MNLPESHPESLHLVLVNAIFLAACSGGGPQMKPYEDEFLRRSREHAQHCLVHRDRIEHFLWASIIIAWYYVRNGRINEAYHSSSCKSRLYSHSMRVVLTALRSYGQIRSGLWSGPDIGSQSLRSNVLFTIDSSPA
jgi:hypothetical protein